MRGPAERLRSQGALEAQLAVLAGDDELAVLEIPRLGRAQHDEEARSRSMTPLSQDFFVSAMGPTAKRCWARGRPSRRRCCSRKSRGRAGIVDHHGRPVLAGGLAADAHQRPLHAERKLFRLGRAGLAECCASGGGDGQGGKTGSDGAARRRKRDGHGFSTLLERRGAYSSSPAAATRRPPPTRLQLFRAVRVIRPTNNPVDPMTSPDVSPCGRSKPP